MIFIFSWQIKLILWAFQSDYLANIDKTTDYSEGHQVEPPLIYNKQEAARHQIHLETEKMIFGQQESI